MANGQPERIPEPASGLSENARWILDVLQERAEPMDAISLSSLTRLPMEDILEAVQELKDAGAVQQVPPEPVHERIAVPA